ncbi:SpaA isopeptide-forming pilin-related protein [Streptomyces sp. NPDC046261]|uniref:MSCRAMM family protein n=1 Tax=Streptomyces sp. NPDC046261 TaxID=3157200 RepID=UPI0033F3D5F7
MKHTRSVCRTPAAAVAVVAAVTGTLAWAPTASAHAPEPTPSTSTAPASRNTPETGGVHIVKKDPGGALLEGAKFTLLDTVNGTKALQGKTNSEGVLRFEGVTPGVYRLKETSTGSSIHELVPDQDVIVTPGQDSPLTITDPFKPADLTVKKTDKASGKPLAGAVINIVPTGKGDSVTLTTTGKDGTASVKLPVTSRSGTEYTATETKAPAGYQLDAKPAKLTAKARRPGHRHADQHQEGAADHAAHHTADLAGHDHPGQAVRQADTGNPHRHRHRFPGPVRIHLRHAGRGGDRVGHDDAHAGRLARPHRR